MSQQALEHFDKVLQYLVDNQLGKLTHDQQFIRDRAHELIKQCLTDVSTEPKLSILPPAYVLGHTQSGKSLILSFIAVAFAVSQGMSVLYLACTKRQRVKWLKHTTEILRFLMNEDSKFPIQNMLSNEEMVQVMMGEKRAFIESQKLDDLLRGTGHAIQMVLLDDYKILSQQTLDRTIKYLQVMNPRLFLIGVDRLDETTELKEQDL